MKRRIRWLPLLMALMICASSLHHNATFASAARFTDANLRRLAQYIDTYGLDDSNGKGKLLIEVDTSDDLIFYYVLRNQSDGLYFDLLISSESENRIVSNTEFVLEESSSYIYVDHIMQFYYYDELVDHVATGKSISKSALVKEPAYSVSGSGSLISNSDLTERFNTTLELLCLFWDTYIYSNLGFGLKNIGFTSYDGFDGGNGGVCTSHSWDTGVVTKQPTCASAGVKTYTCNTCGETKTETLQMTDDHDWDSGVVTKQPTCATTGIKTYTCNICGVRGTQTLEMTSVHSWDAGVVTKQPTCVDSGIKTYTCNICGETKPETLEKTDSHSWDIGVVTKVPTCVDTGVKSYTCNDCGMTKNETLEITDHTFESCVKVDDDTHKHSCTSCGVEEAVPHVWDAGKIIEEPTLESTGLREHYCEDCGATITVVVPKRANGDLNGDQSIDNKDVEYLLWHTLFPSSYPLDAYADYDFSGSVDNKDVEYLLWHTLFPDRYPLQAK